MHSDVVLSSTGAFLMKTVIKNNRQLQMVHFHFGWIWLLDACESALLLISPECVSLCLVFESKGQHSKCHKHIFLSTHQTKKGSSDIRQCQGHLRKPPRHELNQTYQYPNTQMVFDMILCCHIKVDQYQNLKGDSKREHARVH